MGARWHGAGRTGAVRRQLLPRLPLRWQLALACVLPALLALALVGAAATLSTTRAFGRLAAIQDRAALSASLQTYYARTGTLKGYRSPYQLAEQQRGLGGAGPDGSSFGGGLPPGPPPGRPEQRDPPTESQSSESQPVEGQPPEDQPPESQAGPPAPDGLDRSAYLVLDPTFRTVLATPRQPAGTLLPQSGRAQASPVRLGARVIAYLAPSSFSPAPDPRAAASLRQTLLGVLLAVLAAVLLSALLGALLARRLLRPVTALQRALRATRRGEAAPALVGAAGRGLPGEFAELLTAFDDLQAELNRSQRARQRLTADIAHDLNTPLSVMDGTLEALLDGTFAPTPARLTRLKRETEHLRRLVSDLRLLALADAGELRLARVQADVGALLHEAAQRVQPLADLRGVALLVQPPGAPLHAPLDPARLHQVMQNLLSNALAHTPAGGSITLEAGAAPGRLALRVSDTGRGIPAEALPLVFDRLYRADHARSLPDGAENGGGPEPGGSGLGLSICRSIVEAHGGQIGIESVPGEGTSVWVDLPLRADQAGAG